MSEIQQVYKDQIEKTKRGASEDESERTKRLCDDLEALRAEKQQLEQANVQLTAEVARLTTKVGELKAKKQELEQSEKRLAAALAERDREYEHEKGSFRNQFSKYEGKLSKKKDKIRDLILDF